MPWNSVSCVCLPLAADRSDEGEQAPAENRRRFSNSCLRPSLLWPSFLRRPKNAALGPAHAPALQEVIDQFARGVIHLHVKRFHATGQIVEHHDRDRKSKRLNSSHLGIS